MTRSDGVMVKVGDRVVLTRAGHRKFGDQGLELGEVVDVFEYGTSYVRWGRAGVWKMWPGEVVPAGEDGR